MDTREFASFLKGKLLESAHNYDEILCSVSYKNMEEGKWLAGIRTTLVSVADSIPDILKEFYEGKD